MQLPHHLQRPSKDPLLMMSPKLNKEIRATQTLYLKGYSRGGLHTPPSFPPFDLSRSLSFGYTASSGAKAPCPIVPPDIIHKSTERVRRRRDSCPIVYRRGSYTGGSPWDSFQHVSPNKSCLVSGLIVSALCYTEPRRLKQGKARRGFNIRTRKNYVLLGVKHAV